MSNNHGTIASLLHEFVESVDSHADSESIPFTESRERLRRDHPRVKILERRLGELNPEDREHFHRILNQLHRPG